MTFKGGRSSTMSARSRAASISTRKPSSLCRRGSEKFGAEALTLSFMLRSQSCRSSCRSPAPVRGGNRIGSLRRILASCKLTPQQFTDRRFRDLGKEDIAPRPLEIGEPGGAAEGVKFLALDRRAALDECSDDFAPALVW